MFKRCEIVKMWSVNLYCDNCGEHISNCGVLKSDGSSYEPCNPKSFKMWYGHTCPKCGKVTTTDKSYPYMTYAFSTEGEEVDENGILINKQESKTNEN